MQVKMELSAAEYAEMCWGGAKQTVEQMTLTQIEDILDILDDMSAYDGLMTVTELNDIFWFEPDGIAELLGFSNFEDLVKSNKEET